MTGMRWPSGQSWNRGLDWIENIRNLSLNGVTNLRKTPCLDGERPTAVGGMEGSNGLPFSSQLHGRISLYPAIAGIVAIPFCSMARPDGFITPSCISVHGNHHGLCHCKPLCSIVSFLCLLADVYGIIRYKHVLNMYKPLGQIQNTNSATNRSWLRLLTAQRLKRLQGAGMRAMTCHCSWCKGLSLKRPMPAVAQPNFADW